MSHLLLLLYTAKWQEGRSSVTGAPAGAYDSVAYQEYQEVPPWHPLEPKPLTVTQKIELFLNLPALLLAVPFAEILFHSTDLGLLYAAMPLIPILWYAIGRWIDGMLGYVRKGRKLPKSVSGFAAILITGLMILSLVTVTPLNHHRRADTYWAGAALILWSGLFLAMSVSSFRRSQELA